MTQLAPAADPLAGLAEPAVTGACQDPSANPFRPGRYCGGLQINGSASLQPGTYIIDGGTLRLNGNANVTGSGVTFYLANGAGVSMNGNSTLNLSPPISGALSGILFFGSRSNPSSSSVTINGTNGSTLTGTIYFPAQPVAYTGDMQGAGGCTQVIGKTVQWSGNASLAVNCSAWGMSPLAVGGVVKLVE
jgi:hypothetical protein